MDSISLRSSSENLPVSDEQKVRFVRGASKANETKRAVRKHWIRFEAWCAEQNAQALPCAPEILELYLIRLLEEAKKTTTIVQAKWAIDTIHRMKNLPVPGDTETVRSTLAGIKRILGTKTNRKQALTIEQIKTIKFRSDLIGARDKALLLLGFAGGFRRSELIGIDVEHLERTDFGLRINIPRSKTNQEGAEEWVDIVKARVQIHCPVAVLYRWTTFAEVNEGPVFRSVKKSGCLGGRLSSVSAGKIVKWAAGECGMDSSQFGGHSLRAGCATYLLDKQIPLNLVAKQLRHKKLDTTLRYDRNSAARALEGVY